MKKIKKTDIALIAGVVLVIVVGFFAMKGTKAQPTYELPLTLSGEAGMHKLSYTEYQEKIDNKDNFIVIVSSATCSHCQNFMPVAEDFANDEGLPLYYIDTNDFTSDEWTNLEKSNTFFEENSGNWGTPTTLVLAGKESVDSVVGESDSDALLDLYEKYFDIDKYRKETDAS